MFGNSSDGQESESRSDSTSNNRDSKTSDNLVTLLEEDETDEFAHPHKVTSTNSYENLCASGDQALMPLLEAEDDDISNEKIVSPVSEHSGVDFPVSSNTSLPGSRTSRDYSKSSNISLSGSGLSTKNVSQPDFMNSSNVSLPASGNSIRNSQKDFRGSDSSLNEASKHLLDDEGDDISFAATGTQRSRKESEV